MAEQQEQKRPLPVKTLVILAVVLLMEVATVLIVFTIAGQPAEVKAEGALVDEEREAARLVEELVVEAKFHNMKKGETILYETEVYVVVQKKHQQRVQTDIEEKKARISTDMAMIISRAQPAHFAEPTLATLTRQVRAVLEKRLGRETDDEEEEIIKQLLIKRCIPFKADS